MPVIFPPIDSAFPEGLLAIGGSLDTETLLTAYSQGIFPWPVSHDSPLTWFAPDPRGILEFTNLKISKSFKKFLKKTPFIVKFNQDFEQIVSHCALTPRKHEESTWITKEILHGYKNFFNDGYAYCVGTYENDVLVGGLYGVCIGDYVTGESMFHTATNASKFALYSLIRRLELSGIQWIDTQMVTPVIQSFGGCNIPRTEFMPKLNKAVKSGRARKQILP